MINNELVKCLLDRIPGAESVVRDGMCIFVLCKQSDVTLARYIGDLDVGDYSVCAVKARTSFADEILTSGEVLA